MRPLFLRRPSPLARILAAVAPTFTLALAHATISVLAPAPMALADPSAPPPVSDYRRSPSGTICLLQAHQSLAGVQPPLGLERTAELEISADLVWPHLTTTDGTLAPLVEHYGGLASNSRGDPWFEDLFGNRDPASIRWDSLSPEKQRQVVNAATWDQIFVHDRVIHGLTIRKDRASPLSKFQPYVELGDPADVGAVRGVELHYRAPGSASDVAIETRRAAKALGKDRQHLHVHIPMQLDREALRANPLRTTAEMVDFHRRSELFAQMMTVMETSVNLAQNGHSFGPLAHGDFSRTAEAFLRAGVRDAEVGKSAYSKGYVGLRGETFYDQPGLWGLEVRSVHRSLSDSDARALLDGIEASGRISGYGLSSGRIADWLKKSGVDSLPPDWQASGGKTENFERIASDLGRKLLPGTYARASREDVLFTGPRKEAALRIWDQWMATIPAKESMWEDSLTAARLNKVLEGNPSLKFVTHDWSRDPLFYDSPAALEKIELARIAAVRKLARREDQHEVLRGFLRDSGLYGAFGQSLGIKVETLSP